ncbi:type II secretion system protein N [Simiduia curdlanivorans]|uniref:Type II secretion system protein N n=1 Tax=Simiduia curdlanivorans TaxID=1492769 RepID=A0ABV8V2B4_9GAMM|nr:type II secretion system protein N [Simiduia curdlanivorans]MDN3638058.1 type II secretion system protein N [Simiduia curdlanivorans]
MKIWRWIVLGVVLLFVWVLLLAPPTLVANLAANAGLQLQGVSGSLWAGTAKSARLQLGKVRGNNLIFDIGEFSWRLEPFSLLALKACAEVETQLTVQQVKGRVCASAAGNVRAENLRINFPASFIELMAPLEASGRVMLALDDFQLSGAQVEQMTGAGRIENLNVLIGKDWQNFGHLNLQVSAAAAPNSGFDFSLVSDDSALQWQANAPEVRLGNQGFEMHLRSSLKLSESYQLQWGEGLAMMGFEEKDGAYLIETRLP